MQKVHFSQHGIPLPEFMEISDIEGARRAGELFGYPLMIKSKRLAYDGRGNAVAKSQEELSSAVTALGGFSRGLYVEKWAPFVKELAVIVARGKDGSMVCYPVVETVHRDNICHIVKAPADVPWKINKLATDVAQKAVGSLEGAGVFAVELFLTGDSQILLNEVAPRPHNSGHQTIEACYTSQFEQHLRAVVGLPLGDPSMRVPASIMYNILGEDDGEAGFTLANRVIARALCVPGSSVHWYDKPEMRKQRKMGHITLVGRSMGVLEQRLHCILNDQNHQIHETPRVGIIMGSDSDLSVMKDAAKILEMFGVSHEVKIVSAHRTPQMMFSYATSAHSRGIQVIIAGAGGAAHLPGMVASLTPLPVIGVPVRATRLDGVDSLLSIVQMPRGVPVATVAINNATNAALLAVRMLGISDTDLVSRMNQYQEDMREENMVKVEIPNGVRNEMVFIPPNGDLNGNMQSLYQESIYLTEQQQQQQASSSSAASFVSGNGGGGNNCLEIPNGVRNEMVFIPPNGDLNGNVTVSSNDLSFHGQGLSLSLGNQIQYQYHQNMSNQLGFNNQNHTLSCNVDEIGKSKEMLLEQSQVIHQQQINHPSSVGFYNNYRYENSGFVSSVLRSRYLKPTQQLLDEVVNVRRDLKQAVKKIGGVKGGQGDDQFRNDTDQDLVSVTNDSVKAVELSSSERQELQSKKNKLLTMVDEVDKRYNQYYHQMEALASSFEMVTGLGAAKPYTSVALNRISRHFRCLRDAIKGQIQVIKGKLGEKESSDEQGGERIPRLRYLDQRLRQQRALHQQLGMVRPAWRPQRGLPENSVSILRAWLFEHFLHPYPKESEKILLAKQTGLSKNQVANWFINARVRLWKPMIEEMYKEEFGETEVVSKSCQETNNTNNLSGLQETSSHLKHEETSQNLTYSSVEQNHLVFSEPKQARVQGEEEDDQPQEMMNRTSADYDSLMNYHGFGLDDYRYIGLGNQQDGRFSNPHQLHDFVV